MPDTELTHLEALVAEACQAAYDAMPDDLRDECHLLANLSDPPVGMVLVPFAGGQEIRWVGRRLGWIPNDAILAASRKDGVDS